MHQRVQMKYHNIRECKVNKHIKHIRQSINKTGNNLQWIRLLLWQSGNSFSFLTELNSLYECTWLATNRKSATEMVSCWARVTLFTCVYVCSYGLFATSWFDPLKYRWVHYNPSYLSYVSCFPHVGLMRGFLSSENNKKTNKQMNAKKYLKS